MQSQQSAGTPKEPQISIEAAAAATLEIERLRRRNLELEVECQMLKSIAMSPIPSTACISCFAERAKAAICMDQIRALETVVNGLKLQVASYTTPPTTQDVSFLSTTYGPIEVDSFRIIIKSLPSFKNLSKEVDAFYDLLVEETRITSPKAARRLLIKIVRVSRELMDRCNLMDRMKCLEVMSIFHERNAKHEIHFSKLCEPSEKDKLEAANNVPLENLPTQISRLRNSLRAIPSFQNSKQLVDLFCGLWAHGRDMDFFYSNYLLYQLEILSRSVEDRTMLWVAVEIATQWNKQEWIDLIAKMEAASIDE
ncbi:hypothetical protein BDR26DRAFT_851716 [Obelidium mucronatum]|nr:hypothetical protein BDR26DRAFT_851716 [Obelidium mucronatum]